MKKQYLISLLGLAAISISLGNGFSSMTSSSTRTTTSTEPASSSSSLSEEELDTMEEYENEFPDYSIEEIEMGYYSTAAVINDGENDHLYTWGFNSDGQLGLDDTDDRKVPTEVTTLPAGNIEDISVGRNSTAAIVDGDLYTWGDNYYGQLGIDSRADKHTPTKVQAFSGKTVEQISMGNNSSAAIVDDDLYTWGYNNRGQLGLGDTKNKYVPIEVKDFSNNTVEQVSLGYWSSAAIVDGDLYTWGYNIYGQLGLGDIDSRNVPTKVTTFNSGTVEQISLGNTHSAAIADGDLYTWGNNSQGQLGLDDTDNRYVPTEVKEFSDNEIEQISMGYWYSTAVVDNELYTWGLNYDGQLGLGDVYNRHSPVKVAFLPSENQNIEQISAGYNSSSAIVNGALYTWGDNYYGQLGLGDKSDRNTPQVVWKPPYIDSDSIYSSATPINDDVDKIKINYKFETNLEVEDVTILLEDNGTYGGVIVPDIEEHDEVIKGSKPDEYIGELIIKNLVPGAKYKYTINLNYINYQNELKSIYLDGGEFSISVESVTPSIEDINPQNQQADSIEVDFDLDLGHDKLNTPYMLEEITINDYLHVQERTYTEDNFEIDDQGEGTLVVSDLYPNTSYSWDVTFVLSSPLEEDKIELNDELNTFETKSAKSKSNITSSGKAEVKEDSTEATIDYKIELGNNDFGEEVTIAKVEWMKGKDTLALSTSQATTNDALFAEGLTPNTTYANTYLVAEMSDGSVTNIETVDTFVTGVDPSQIEASKITTSEFNLVSPTEANIGYSIELGKDEQGNEVTPTKVEWMNGKETLDLLVTEEPSGTLTATHLAPNTTYDNTFIVAEMSDGTTTNICEVNSFTMDTAAETSSITSTNKVVLMSPTEASIDYVVTPGKDDDGNPLTVSEVMWLDGGKELATSKLVSGTLTSEKLSPNKLYDSTTLVAKMSDGTHTEAFEVGKFTACPGDADSIVRVDGDVEVYGPTEAKVDYQVTPGKDKDGLAVTVEEVRWMNGEVELDSAIGEIGVLEADNLVGATTYKTTIVVDMSDDTTVTVTVDAFTTGDIDLETPEIDCIDVETTATTATFDYVILDEGIAANGEPYILSNIEIRDDNQKVRDSEHISDGNDKTGSVTVDGLDPNTSYEGWTMEATFSDTATKELEEKVTDNIGTFITNKVDLEAPEIEYTVDEITETTTTFNYVVIDEGIDGNGNPYTLTNLEIKDANGDLVPNQTVNGEYGKNGSITVTGLTAGTTYSGWTMDATFSGTNDDQVEKISTDLDEFGTSLPMTDLDPSTPTTPWTDLDPSTPVTPWTDLDPSTPNSFGTWTIIGISAAAILLVAIIAGGLTYFIKRYKA